MSINTITVNLPDHLYRRLRIVATETNQEVADLLVAGAEVILALDDDDASLPSGIADELAAMQLFSDNALWQATEALLSQEQQKRLGELTQKQGLSDLTIAEQDELNQLLTEYDYSVIRRAQAFTLLSLRGHSIPDLNTPHLNN